MISDMEAARLCMRPTAQVRSATQLFRERGVARWCTLLVARMVLGDSSDVCLCVVQRRNQAIHMDAKAVSDCTGAN
jgi:hypothetical protein